MKRKWSYYQGIEKFSLYLHQEFILIYLLFWTPRGKTHASSPGRLRYLRKLRKDEGSGEGGGGRIMDFNSRRKRRKEEEEEEDCSMKLLAACTAPAPALENYFQLEMRPLEGPRLRCVLYNYIFHELPPSPTFCGYCYTLLPTPSLLIFGWCFSGLK